MIRDLKTPTGCTKLSLLINIFLFFLKLFAGIAGRSQALVADALNSLLDIVANIIVWIGIRIAEKPPDREHPYGHGNADTLAAVFVALVLILTGGYVGREAIDTIINKDFKTPTYLATGAAFLTIIIKEILYRFTLKIGKSYKSSAVIANAKDHRADAVISLGTLIGIFVAQTKYPIFDPIAGLWVAIFILKQAIEIIRENINTLMVSSPEAAYLDDIREIICNTDGVINVVWLKGRRIGSGYYLDTAIFVDGKISVKEGHEITRKIRRLVRNSYPDIVDILVHVEPKNQ